MRTINTSAFSFPHRQTAGGSNNAVFECEFQFRFDSALKCGARGPRQSRRRTPFARSKSFLRVGTERRTGNGGTCGAARQIKQQKKKRKTRTERKVDGFQCRAAANRFLNEKNMLNNHIANYTFASYAFKFSVTLSLAGSPAAIAVRPNELRRAEIESEFHARNDGFSVLLSSLSFYSSLSSRSSHAGPRNVLRGRFLLCFVALSPRFLFL